MLLLWLKYLESVEKAAYLGGLYFVIPISILAKWARGFGNLQSDLYV